MPENISIKSDELSEIARGQAVVEARQPLEGERRVLSVSAHAAVSPSEVFAGEARYTGKVRFDCLVKGESGIECISAVAEFSDKISANSITAGMMPVIVPEIINTEASVENGTIRLVAVVDTKAYAVTHCDLSCMGEPEPGIYCEKQTVHTCGVACDAAETAYITDGMSDIKASEIMCCSSSAVVTGAECGDGEIKVSGAVYSVIIVKTDDGLAASYRMVTPFVKSLSAVGLTPDATAVATAIVTDSAATLTVADDKSIELAVTLRLCATAFTESETELAVDVFCADNELDATFEGAKISVVEKQMTVTDSVDGQVAIGADKNAADNILLVTDTFCTLTDARVEDNKVFVEGLVGGNIVYYNAEKNDVDSIAFRLPFAMPLAAHTDLDTVGATACVCDVAVKVRRESVFDIKAEVMFTLSPRSSKTVNVVTSIKLGAPIPRPDATLIVHIAKPGETLWQAAKALGCSPESVSEQNDAPAPYVGGERLINFIRQVRRVSE